MTNRHIKIGDSVFVKFVDEKDDFNAIVIHLPNGSGEFWELERKYMETHAQIFYLNPMCGNLIGIFGAAYQLQDGEA